MRELGDEGHRRDADFIIPDATEEDGLAVLLHELATPDRNQVRRLTG